LSDNVSAGLSDDVELAHNLMARYWIRARDENKENSSISILRATRRKYRAEEMREMMRRMGRGTSGNTGGSVVIGAGDYDERITENMLKSFLTRSVRLKGDWLGVYGTRAMKTFKGGNVITISAQRRHSDLAGYDTDAEFVYETRRKWFRKCEKIC